MSADTVFNICFGIITLVALGAMARNRTNYRRAETWRQRALRADDRALSFREQLRTARVIFASRAGLPTGTEDGAPQPVRTDRHLRSVDQPTQAMSTLDMT